MNYAEALKKQPTNINKKKIIFNKTRITIYLDHILKGTALYNTIDEIRCSEYVTSAGLIINNWGREKDISHEELCQIIDDSKIIFGFLYDVKAKYKIQNILYKSKFENKDVYLKAVFDYQSDYENSEYYDIKIDYTFDKNKILKEIESFSLPIGNFINLSNEELDKKIEENNKKINLLITENGLIGEQQYNNTINSYIREI